MSPSSSMRKSGTSYSVSYTHLDVYKRQALDLVPKVKVSDWVLVHAGYGIEIIDEQFANETLELIAQFPELIDEDHPGMGEGVA